EAQKQLRTRFAKVLGSAVNPVLREGNSDRRVANAVKQYARKHPHSMGAWSGESRTHVAHMLEGDFFANEQSVAISEPGTLRIELQDRQGNIQVLKQSIAVQAEELVSATFMSCRSLRAFYEAQIEDARARGVLLSLHLKATMMKVSDPIMFGHAVSVYYREVFAKHAASFQALGVDPDNGIGDVYAKIRSLPAAQRAQIEADLQA